MGADAVILADFIIRLFSLDSFQLKINKWNPRVNLYYRSNRLTVTDYFSNGNNILLLSAAYWTFCKYVDHILGCKNQVSTNTKQSKQSHILLNYSTVKSEINSKKTAETTQIYGD